MAPLRATTPNLQAAGQLLKTHFNALRVVSGVVAITLT